MKITIDISKKTMQATAVVVIIISSGLVVAYGTSNPQLFGHSGGEINVDCPGKGVKTLNECLSLMNGGVSVYHVKNKLEICGLVAGKTYHTIAYGTISGGLGNEATISPTVTVNNAYSSTVVISNYPDGTAPITIPLSAAADANGCLKVTASTGFSEIKGLTAIG